LGRAALVRLDAPLAVFLLYDGSLQEEFHQPQDASGAHAPGHLAKQRRMRNRIEAAAQAGIDDLVLFFEHRAADRIKRLMGAAPRLVSLAVFMEVSFKYRLEQQHQRCLSCPVLSFTVGMPSGRCLPSAFGIQTLSTGLGR